MLISVVITTRNEEKNIEECSQSIKSQNLNVSLLSSDSDALEIEIIVVDNNSTDSTKKIAKKYTNKIFNYGPERSAQRNLGIKKASGKYVLYLDADMRLSKNVLSECVQMCECQSLIALYIPEKIIGQGFWVKIRDFERSFYDATAIDCVRFIRRDEFLKIDGFDENLTGPEDWDFDRRIRAIGEVGIIKSPLYHNEEAFSFKRYLQKKSYYSKNFGKYIDKWGRKDRIIKKQLGFLYRYFGVFFEKGKWKKLLRYPLLALGMYSLRIIIGFLWIWSASRRQWII